MALRAFIAIEPPAQVRQALGDLIVRLRKAPGKASWVRPDNMHLTLRFLGDVSEKQVAVLVEQLGELCARTPAFNLSVAGLGAFPNLRRPSVIWAGVVPLDPDLRPLQQAVEDAARAAGLAREDKSFHPHITLARLKDSRNAEELSALVESYKAFDAGAFPVSHVLLLLSELTPKGPIYTCIEEFSLS